MLVITIYVNNDLTNDVDLLLIFLKTKFLVIFIMVYFCSFFVIELCHYHQKMGIYKIFFMVITQNSESNVFNLFPWNRCRGHINTSMEQVFSFNPPPSTPLAIHFH